VEVPFQIPSIVTLETDVRPGDWIRERLLPHRRDVGVVAGQIVPSGFDAYARLFHPAIGRGRTRIRWRELAERYGTTIHPQMQFAHIVGTRAIDELDDIEPPFEGYLLREETAWLAEALAPHTAATTTCWFALWDGYGHWPGRAGITWNGDGTWSPVGSLWEIHRSADEAHERTKRFQRQLAAIPTMSIPGRDYFLFRGPLEAASHLAFDEVFQSPNLWWPDDRAWCVATEIDGDSTYIGGSEACIAAVLGDERFEALPSSIDHRFDAWGDEVNPRPPGMPPRWGMPG
jgi:hypothetical protein